MKECSGTITIIQESRFWLTDDAGVGHHFTLAHDAALPNTPLSLLQHENRCVIVQYTQQTDTTSNVAHTVTAVAN